MLKNLVKVFNRWINIENTVNLDYSIVINFETFKYRDIFIYFLLSKIYAKCHNLKENNLLIINITLSNKHLETIIINLEKGCFPKIIIYYKLSKLYSILLNIKNWDRSLLYENYNKPLFFNFSLHNINNI